MLKIQDKEYILRFDINAVALLEEVTNKSITELFEDSLGVSTLRALLYSGLKKNHKLITLERAGNLIQDMLDEGRNLEELTKIITEAFEKANLTKKKMMEQ